MTFALFGAILVGVAGWAAWLAAHLTVLRLEKMLTEQLEVRALLVKHLAEATRLVVEAEPYMRAIHNTMTPPNVRSAPRILE